MKAGSLSRSLVAVGNKTSRPINEDGTQPSIQKIFERKIEMKEMELQPKKVVPIVTPKKEDDMLLGAIGAKLLPIAAQKLGQGIGKLFGKKKAKASASIGKQALGNVIQNAKTIPLNVTGTTRRSATNLVTAGGEQPKTDTLKWYQKISTGMWVAIGAGVVFVIGVVVFIFKKRKR